MYAILFLPLLSVLRDSFRRRAVLQLELIAVRHQLATMKRTSRRPSLRPTDRLLWVLLSRLLPNWREMLVIVKPETVIGWHRKGFRLYWTWKSRRRRGGRPPIPRDVRDLISRMSRENPLSRRSPDPRRTPEARHRGHHRSNNDIAPVARSVPLPGKRGFVGSIAAWQPVSAEVLCPAIESARPRSREGKRSA